MTDPRVCRTPFTDFDHLFINEADELRRLNAYRGAGLLTMGQAKRWADLMLRRYVPPGMPEPGEAA